MVDDWDEVLPPLLVYMTLAAVVYLLLMSICN